MPAEERRLDRPHGKAVHRRQAGAARRQLFASRRSTARASLVGEAGLGNRKDIRDAVSAARACKAWPEATGYNRSQVLYFLAENLSIRADEFAARIAQLTGAAPKAARAEVDLSVERLFGFAGMADKFEGRVHQPPARAVTLALHEPVGVLGIVAPDDAPLLGLVSLVAPALAMGNTVVAVPSSRHPLVATDLYQVIESSDVPAGAINIVTGKAAELAAVLAKHDDVDGLWLVADADDLQGGRSRLDRQSEARLDQRRPHARLDRPATLRAGDTLPAPRDRGRRTSGCLTEICTSRCPSSLPDLLS